MDQKTIPFQLDELRAYSLRRGWTVAMERHEAKSGTAERRERAEIIEAARRREIDVVLVWKLDRWGRSLVDLVSTLRELSDLRVAFVSVTEAFDLTTSAGRALAGMLAVFAEFESGVRRERQAAGIDRARREGRHLGRPAKMDITMKLKARKLWKELRSPSAVAAELGVSRTTVWRALRE